MHLVSRVRLNLPRLRYWELYTVAQEFLSVLFLVIENKGISSETYLLYSKGAVWKTTPEILSGIISVYRIDNLCFCVLKVFPMTSSGGPITEYPFIRTGLLGFIGPGGLVFVIGKMDGLMVVSGRRHNADDIVATALAVEPMKFVYRGRFDPFSYFM